MNKTTILLLEDSPTWAKEIKAFLEKEGFKVIHAASVSGGLNQLKETSINIDLIVCDWQMPTKNKGRISPNAGIAFLNTINFYGGQDGSDKLPANISTKTPFIMCSSNSSDEHINKALSAGAHEYVIKDSSFDVTGNLLKAIHKLLPPQ